MKLPLLHWHNVPLHIALLVPVMALILVTAGSTSYLSFHNTQQVVKDTTLTLRNELTARIEEHLRRYLSVPYLVNQSVFNALKLGVLDPEQPHLIGRSLCQQLRLFPELNAISLANAQGGLISAQRQEDGFVRMLMTQDFQPGTNQVFEPDGKYRCKRVGSLPELDAREEVWFQVANTHQQMHWSPFYLIPYLPETGFSLSQPWFDSSTEPPNLRGVLMTELRLSRLGEFMNSLEMRHEQHTHKLHTFLMQRDGLMIASSETGQPFSLASDGNLLQHRTLESKNPLIKATAQFIQQTFPDLNVIQSPVALEFTWQGDLEFLKITPFKDEFGLDWLIVVVLPESAFVQHVHENQRMIFWFSLVLLLIALILSWQLAQVIIRPIQGLSSAAERLIAEQWPIHLPDSHIIEIQQLSNAFTHMSAQMRNTFILLEQRVDERTHKLQASLQALEHSERALQESEAKYHVLVEQIPVTVYEASLQNRSHILYISPQIEKLLGISKETWLSDEQTWLKHLHSQDRGRVLAEYQNYLTYLHNSDAPIDDPFSSEYRMMSPNGKEIWINDYSVPVYDETSCSVFLRGVMQDVTERKTAEKELLTYRKHLEYLIKTRTSALEDVNKQLKAEIFERKRMEILEREYMEKLAHTSRISMLGEMAAQIAHQLNQPLAAVASYSVACKYLLQNFANSGFANGSQEKIRVTLEKINYEAQHAGEIIHRLRALSRSNEMERNTLDINQLVKDAEKLIVVESKWRNINLVLELAPELPCVMADKILLEQVILNLAHNALAALDDVKEQPRLLTIQTLYIAEKQEVLVRVIDTGPGLPEEMIEQIFTSFFTTKPHGIGLGLSICLSIAKAHDGRLWAEPNAQGGTIFTLSLPACQDDLCEPEGMLYEV